METNGDGMKRVLHVARTEVLEHRRQPWMLFILTANYAFWIAIFLGILLVLATAAKSPQLVTMLEKQSASLGICDGESALNAMLRLTTSTFGALLFTTLPLFVAIMSGYSVLHDRAKGTLPFLMLAPLSRYQLLLGKLLGAMAIPVLLHLAFVGGSSLVVRQMDVMEPFAALFGSSAGWWVAYLLGAPASGLLVGSLGTVISGLSRDVRTSMQFTSFFIGVLSLGFGFVLFDGISSGVALQVAFAVGCSAIGLAIVFLGSRIISRDIVS
jgi:ABC-type transport system involved in multi-copper enzyme maturation permease subunit